MGEVLFQTVCIAFTLIGGFFGLRTWKRRWNEIKTKPSEQRARRDRAKRA